MRIASYFLKSISERYFDALTEQVSNSNFVDILTVLRFAVSGDHFWFLDLRVDRQHTICPGLKRKGQFLCVDG